MCHKMSQGKQPVAAAEVMEHRGHCRCKWLAAGECKQLVFCVNLLLLMKTRRPWLWTAERWWLATHSSFKHIRITGAYYNISKNSPLHHNHADKIIRPHSMTLVKHIGYITTVKWTNNEETWGAPSISSIMRQFGRGSAPSTAFICVALSIFSRNTSALRSSLPDAKTSHNAKPHFVTDKNRCKRVTQQAVFNVPLNTQQIILEISFFQIINCIIIDNQT